MISFDEFTSRLAFQPAPGQRPWLLPDPSSERRVRPRSGKVLQAVAPLVDGLELIPANTAAEIVRRYTIYTSFPLDRSADRASAAGSISRHVSDELATWHRHSAAYGLRDESRHTVATFGGGAGIMYQRAYPPDMMGVQWCYILDPACGVHGWPYWER